MKIKSEYEMISIGDESMLIPVGDEAQRFHGLFLLNEESAFIVRLLKKEQTADALVSAMLDEYEIAPDTAARDIEDLLSRLDSMHLLESAS